MKRNLILLAICAIVAAIYFWDKSSTEKKEEREAKEKELFSITQDEVKEVTIEKKSEIFKAVKDGDSWKIVTPLETSGDKSNWDSVVRNFADGKKQRVIAEDPKDLSPFGLDDPGFKVTLAGVDGATSTTMLIGAESPISGKYYGAIEGTSEVVTILSGMKSSVDKKLFDFRDKTILALEMDKVQKIEITADDSHSVLQRRNADQWILTEPMPARVDSTKVQDLINKVKNSRIKQFITETADDYEPYGLTQPATKVVFWSGDSSQESSWAAQALLLGATNDREHLYAKRESQENVFSVDPKDLDKIPNDISEMRMKKLSEFKTWEINRFKIISAGDVIAEASKSLGEWTLLQPQNGEADYSSVSSVARAITDLEAAEFVQGATEEYGLGDPSLIVELTGEKGVETIALGKPLSATDVTHYYYSARPEPLEILAVKNGDIQNFLNKVKEMKLENPPETAPSEETGDSAGEQTGGNNSKSN